MIVPDSIQISGHHKKSKLFNSRAYYSRIIVQLGKGKSEGNLKWGIYASEFN